MSAAAEAGRGGRRAAHPQQSAARAPSPGCPPHLCSTTRGAVLALELPDSLPEGAPEQRAWKQLGLLEVAGAQEEGEQVPWGLTMGSNDRGDIVYVANNPPYKSASYERMPRKRGQGAVYSLETAVLLQMADIWDAARRRAGSLAVWLAGWQCDGRTAAAAALRH